ncbi:extensin-like domain-containing protein [Terrihabitans sp. B22-R8]|uniref:extensin-like domain-containing protein n=1 Tax=Terrihabitans sp. B22-R8 TaxID=3425128 RepID=UPI00403C1556
MLGSCGRFGGPEREPWRDAAEARCIRAGAVQASSYVEPIKPIRDKLTCGMEQPFRIHALADGSVEVQPAARLACPVTASLNYWMQQVVQPSAQANFGQPIVAVKNAASYGCRTRNHKRGAKLSEHGFGNALDIAAFILADGRRIDIKRHWRGAPDERAFLRQVTGGACGPFKTVLGPGSDGHHEDHLHLDLARHGKSGRNTYCRPRPQNVPSAPQFPQAGPAYGGSDGRYLSGPMSYAAEPGWPLGGAGMTLSDDAPDAPEDD